MADFHATIRLVLDAYEREHVNRTVVAKERFHCARVVLDAALGQRVIQTLTTADIQAFMDTRLQTIQISTLRRELGVLTAALNHAVRTKRLASTDLPYFRMPDAPKTEATWLTTDEISQLFSAADSRTQDFIEIAYFTAARITDVVTLTAAQVNLDSRRINYNSGERRETKKRKAITPIGPLLFPTVERLVQAAPDISTALLAPYGVKTYRRGFEAAVRASGLSHKRPTPHSLRHSRATHLLQSGVSLYDVAKLLGDTVATVERVYGHHSTTYLASAIEKADDALRGR